MACYAKKAGGSAATTNAKENRASESSENRSISPRPEAKREQNVVQSGERELKVFFSQIFARRNVPDDFKIGPLADYYKNTGEDSSILARVNVFCLSLVENELKDELFDDQNRYLLKQSLQYSIYEDHNLQNWQFHLMQYYLPSLRHPNYPIRNNLQC